MSDHSQVTPLGLEPSFGFGDRTGLATPGHVEALRRAGQGIRPIFAQQSIREMVRTNRSPRQVMADARAGAAHAGYDGPMGADADHLKAPEDVSRTVEAGFTFFTIDPSDCVDAADDRCDDAALRERYREVQPEVPWMEAYRGRSIDLPTGSRIEFSESACMRCAVKYGRAIRRAIELADHIRKENERAGHGYEIELSVDETEQPTSLAEHYIIADQCLQAGMKLISLAPRYIGTWEKGVDYEGDVDALERSLADHAAVARMLGPYKLSLHSGSDKLAMYGAFARATQGLFHVKTAGTSYLEGLRVVARHDVPLFREIIDFGRLHYETDRATYHVSAALDRVPPPEQVPEAGELERLYLGDWSDVPPGRGFTEPGRQILHCTFGSVLTDPALGAAIRSILESHPETYADVLADHFSRHLCALTAGM